MIRVMNKKRKQKIMADRRKVTVAGCVRATAEGKVSRKHGELDTFRGCGSIQKATVTDDNVRSLPPDR